MFSTSINSPAMSTPYLDATIDTPFTPPFFNIENDISPFMSNISINAPMLRHDVCLSGYLDYKETSNEGATAKFNGNPTELLIDKSKNSQWPSFAFEDYSGLFPPLMNEDFDLFVKEDEFNATLDLGSPLSEPEISPEVTPEITPEPLELNEKKGNKRGKRVQSKLHQCPHCNHTSKRRYNLSTHIKTHDKQRIKEFECSQCLHRFDRRHDRDRHMATVHRNKRAIVCKSCSIRFSRRDAFNRHLLQRHGQDDFD